LNVLNIKYDFPYGGLAFTALIFLIALCWYLHQYRQQQLAKFATPDLLSKILVPRNEYVYLFKSLGLLVVWLLATIALTQPKGVSPLNEKSHLLMSDIEAKNTSTKKQSTRKSHLVIFLIDASMSMNAKDSRNGKSRFVYAKEIADEVIRHLDGETASLFAYTSDLTQLSPPTPDYFFFTLNVASDEN